MRSSNETADWNRKPRWLRTQEGEMLSEEGEGAESDSSLPAVYHDEGSLRRVDSGYVNRQFELARNNRERELEEEEKRKVQARAAKSLETRFNEQDTRNWSLATMVRRKAVLASEFFFRTVFSGEVSDRLYTPEKREKIFETRAYVARPTRASRGICSNCNREFERWFLFFRARRYCHYCHDYVCMRCISNQKAVIPQYLYYKSDWCEHVVCRRAL